MSREMKAKSIARAVSSAANSAAEAVFVTAETGESLTGICIGSNIYARPIVYIDSMLDDGADEGSIADEVVGRFKCAAVEWLCMMN